MLERYVEFTFWDHTATVGPQKPVAYGVLHRYREVEGQAVPTYRYRICVSAHLVWPLLKDEYTIAEKAACSLQIAGVILHELGVSHSPTNLVVTPLTEYCMICSTLPHKYAGLC